MSMFIDTDQGSIPVTAVRTVRYARGGNVLLYVDSDHRLVDGALKVTAGQWERALRTYPLSTQPAQPGTYMLFAGLEKDDGQFWVIRSPVIAWSLSADGNVWPVTTDGVNDGMSDDWGGTILHPDGIVISIQDRQWDTFDEWKADAEKQHREAASRRAKGENPAGSDDECTQLSAQ